MTIGCSCLPITYGPKRPSLLAPPSIEALHPFNIMVIWHSPRSLTQILLQILHAAQPPILLRRDKRLLTMNVTISD